MAWQDDDDDDDEFFNIALRASIWALLIYQTLLNLLFILVCVYVCFLLFVCVGWLGFISSSVIVLFNAEIIFFFRILYDFNDPF